jgi:hypothetical protein
LSRGYEELARLPRREHAAIFAAGSPPKLDELTGWDFRGWNCSLVPKLGGFQKFVKGFYRSPEHPRDECAGFNTPVIQNGIDGEWLGLPADDAPRRFGFYRVRRADATETCGAPIGALLLNYGVHPANPKLEVSRLLRDVLVKVEGSPDLLLGKAHLDFGRWLFAGYFLLERRRRHDFRG